MSVNPHPGILNSRLPLVVKIGGSLMDRVDSLIPILNQSPRPLLIVPGGGLFADIVRNLRLQDDTSSHWMAVAAMDQYGWFLASYGLEVSEVMAVPEKTFVFLPYTCLRRQDPLPHTWSVTSDTIAAWIADFLKLELLVLKSVDGIFDSGILQEAINKNLDCDEVDPFFIDYVLKNRIRATIINGLIGDRVEKYLNGEPVPRTVIGTTF